MWLLVAFTSLLCQTFFSSIYCIFMLILIFYENVQLWGFSYIHLYDLCLCIPNSANVIIYIFTQYLRKKYNRKSNFNCDYVHKINKINHFHFYIILYTFLFVRIFYLYILTLFSFREKLLALKPNSWMYNFVEVWA